MKKLEKNLNKVGGLISIARKGGYVIIGMDNLKNHTQKLYLLLVDETAGASLARESMHLAESRQILLLKVQNLGQIMAIENCKIIGIKNKALSESIEKCLKGE